MALQYGMHYHKISRQTVGNPPWVTYPKALLGASLFSSDHFSIRFASALF